MLYVTHITGQVIDLKSGQTSSGLVIQNERGETVNVPISDEKFQELAKLWLSEVGKPESRSEVPKRPEVPYHEPPSPRLHGEGQSELFSAFPSTRSNGSTGPNGYADPVSGVESA